MSARSLRWGLLGTANINQALIPPLRSSARNTLTAIASRTEERAVAYAQENHIPRSFGSYEAMLADPDVDVVYVSLPNSLHAEWAIKAAQAGKHVLCEKPLAVTVQEVDAVMAAAKAAGVVVVEAFMYRHHAQTLKVKAMVDGGRLGEIRLVRGSFSFDISGRPDDVRLKSELGGGAIWDIGCYPISYTRYILGAEPVEVFGWQVTGAGGVDETFVGQMRFSGDVMGQFDCSFHAPYRTHIEIVGSRASLTIPSPFRAGPSERLTLASGEDVETIDVTSHGLYLGEVEDMADAVLLGKPPRIPLSWSRGNVATIVDLLASAQQGRPVRRHE